jgi:hypothetical protein
MAIPKSKYSAPRHTPGLEYTLQGKEYRGWYVETFQKRYYTGKTITDTSKEIFPIQNQKVQDNIFIEQEIIPSTEDLNKGVFNRYVVQKINNKKIIEVTKERYSTLLKKSAYRGVIIPWITKGPSENIFFNNYPYFGAAHRNKQTVTQAENTISGITNFFKDYSEFVE